MTIICQHIDRSLLYPLPDKFSDKRQLNLCASSLCALSLFTCQILSHVATTANSHERFEPEVVRLELHYLKISHVIEKPIKSNVIHKNWGKLYQRDKSLRKLSTVSGTACKSWPCIFNQKTDQTRPLLLLQMDSASCRCSPFQQTGRKDRSPHGVLYVWPTLGYFSSKSNS